MRCFKVILFVISLLAFTNISHGQIFNFEKLRSRFDTIGVKGSVPFQFKFQERQVQLIDYSLSPNLAAFTPKHSYFALASVHFVKTEDEKAESHGFAHLRWNINREKKLSYEIFAQAQYDEVRGMDQRFLGGGGIRLNLKDSSSLRLTFGAGIMHEYEEWSFEEEHDTNNYLKNTNYLSIQYDFSDEFTFILVAYWQSRFETFDKPRIIGDVNLTYDITKRLELHAQFLMLHDAAPVVAIEKTIYTFNTGLRFDF